MEGKFGSDSKLRNTISIEPHDFVLANSSNKTNLVGQEFRQLAKYCIPRELVEDTITNELNQLNLNKIVEVTHDLIITVEDNHKFYAHKVYCKFKLIIQVILY